MRRIEEQHRVYKNRIKVGVEEKKKTQGMRRDLGHIYGVFIILFLWCAPSPPFWLVSFFRRAKIWMTEMLEN